MIRAAFCLFVAAFAGIAAADFDVRGRVLLEGDQPAAGAEVWLSQDRVVRTAKTDRQGRFHFREVSAGPTELVAHHEGHALDGYAGFLADHAEVDVRLGPAARLSVRLVDTTMSPVPAARVRAMLVADRFPVLVEDLEEHGFPPLRAGDDGIVHIDHLPVGGFVKLVVTHPNYADSFVSYLPVNDKRQDIILHPGIRVQGRVRTPAGHGLAGARILVQQAGTGGVREISEKRSDPEGFFSVRLPEGDYSVSVSHPEYASPDPSPLGVWQEDGADEPVLQLSMLPPRHLRGRLLLPDGSPCGGARVTYRIGATIFADTLSDAQGRFTLRVARAKGILNLHPPEGLFFDGLRDIPVDLQDRKEAALGDFQFQALPLLAGNVVDADGAPLANVLVGTPDLAFPLWAITDEAGAFALQLRQTPEEAAVRIRAEHPTRFLRADVAVPLNAPDRGALLLRLAAFEPDLATRPARPNSNDFSAILGKPAPDWTASDWFNAQPMAPAALRGKVVLLFFWAGFLDTPEFYNQAELLRALHTLYRDVDDVVLVSFHDGLSEADEIAAFIRDFHIAYPVARDADPFQTFNAYGIQFLPDILLVDRTGVVRHHQVEGRLLELIKDLRRR